MMPSINFMKVHQPNMPAPEFEGKSITKTKFADSIVENDTRIGRVMEKVRALGLDKNTYVFWTTDDGRLHRIGKDGSMPDVTFVGVPGQARVALDRANVYVSNEAIRAIYATGKDSRFRVDAIFVEQETPGAIASDGQALYWVHVAGSNIGGLRRMQLAVVDADHRSQLLIVAAVCLHPFDDLRCVHSHGELLCSCMPDPQRDQSDPSLLHC